MKTLAGYTIKQLFSRDRKFNLYHGVRNDDQQKILLKISHKEPSANDLITLQHEYQILSQLDLPNIIHVYDLIKQDDQVVLVMEDTSGFSLRDYLKKQPLSLIKFFQIAIELIDALSMLHMHHIIHKNINPKNIILDPNILTIKLIDFSIASQLTQESYAPIHLNNVEGELAYLSPEQTGRMNRPIDYRSDFYSLGVTFYEMLTGVLPFTSDDPLEMIHNHLARLPDDVTTMNPQIPPQVAAIVGKLLAKMPEERYVSGSGLKADIMECQKQWHNKNQIDIFALGQQDIYEYLTLSQKIYGREAQIQQLLETFDGVRQGNTELLLVSGYSGIGKSSLVKEVYKPITQMRGYFIAGKYDQLQRSKPYSAIIEAFKNLVNRLLQENDENLQLLRQQLFTALGNNAQIIIDVIPDVELIIGQQPAVIDLPFHDAENRFMLTLQGFIRALAQSSHPLTLFLDDIQWIDNASLQLINSLLSDHDLHYFLLIGAYRDNEVSIDHPLSIALNTMARNNVAIKEISLSSLGKKDIQHFLADSFHCGMEDAETLAALLLERTHGNPFFINQFLKVLHQKNLLTFFYEKRQWQWNIANIQLHSITENIVELLTYRISQLPKETQELLKLAACIGYVFNLQTLAIISEQTTSETMQKLAYAIAQNLIVPLEGSYKIAALMEGDYSSEDYNQIFRYQFLHDRIQQSAYSLINEDIGQSLHLKIGRLLLKQKILLEDDVNLFEIVNHFIQSIELITDQDEKYQIAEYCLWAGKKSRASTAYQAAKKYLEIAAKLLKPIKWQEQREIAFSTYKELAVCQYLTGEFSKAEKNFQMLIKHTRRIENKIEYYKLYCEMLATLNKHNEAIKHGIAALNLVGIRLPAQPKLMHILYTILKIKMHLGFRRVQTIELFPIKDPVHRATIDLISQLFNSAFIVDQNLFLLLTCTNVNLSLRHGYAQSTGFAAMGYAFIMMHALNRYNEGVDFVEFFNKLSARQLAPNFSGKNYFVMGSFIDPYRYPLNASLETITKAYHSSYDVGDLAYSNYSNIMLILLAQMAGKPLSAIEKYIRTTLSFIDKIKTDDFRHLAFFFYYSLQCLSHTDLQDNQINKFEQEILASQNKTEKSFFYGHCTKLYYLLGQYTVAKEYGVKHEEVANYALGLISVPGGLFYFAMAITTDAKNIKNISTKNIKKVKKIIRYLGQLTKWCSVNFKHFHLLLLAEMARLNHKSMPAIQLYNQAISAANEQNVLDVLGIANEAAGRFYSDIELNDIARLHIQNAHYIFQKWGAYNKCKLLEKQYPDWFQYSAEPNAINENLIKPQELSVESMDVLSVLKSTQVFSSEIHLDKLLKKLLHILIQNAGAQRGILLSRDNDQWYVEAEGNINNQKINLTQSDPLENRKDISLSLIQTVLQKQEKISIQNSQDLEPYLPKDSYLEQIKPQSLLVLPIYFQSQLRYILYLENRSTSYAFTSKHIEILQLLASQAAISLENAHLYYHASHDPLTKLANRNLLYQIFNHASVHAKLHNKMIAILFMDIDNFKKINDTLGHEVGDKILIYFAKKLQSCLREGDVAARLGGDEFILMLQDIDDVDQVTHIIEQLLKQLLPPTYIMDHEIYLSSSIGVSLYPKDGTGIQELLKQADITLYEVKSSGKGYYQYYTTKLFQKLRKEYAREIALRYAFERRELYLAFQPIFTSKTRELTHFEVLLRWPHPTEGLIQAKEFIPLAEKTGLIVPIGEWVLKTACLQIKNWELMGLPLVPVAVNVSGLQFQHQTVNEVVRRVIEETKIDPQFLELEFTESVFIDKSEKIRNDIAALKKLNVKLTIDDFGTYFSSLSYLKRLPIDTIKIDQSFVRDINQDKDSDAIILAIIAMAHNLKLRVIAEGIETKYQLLFLEEHGVDELQGYLLGVPMSAQDCMALLERKVNYVER